ncbi:MAG: hypothetical protein K0S27_1222 [Gammaproteobacteria bacterium]|nr:hypothetical protein [Gammaproteobacteria bacterium]
MSGAAINSSLIPIAGYVRPFVGYHFTDYLALEMGYDDLVNNSYAGGDGTGWGTLGPDHYRLYAIDLAGKFFIRALVFMLKEEPLMCTKMFITKVFGLI